MTALIAARGVDEETLRVAARTDGLKRLAAVLAGELRASKIEPPADFA
jgi:hypothetical protein